LDANCTIDRLVLETLGPVPKDRKCFRLINGILMERTVADVVPALQTNAEGLKNVLEGLVKQYKDKQQEMEAWKVRLFYFRSSFALFRQSDMKSI
jgi:prefoldin subunit 2